MYKIGELSRLCRIPVKTLRYYDNEGVLVPDEIDRFTGYRYYSAAMHTVRFPLRSSLGNTVHKQKCYEGRRMRYGN